MRNEVKLVVVFVSLLVCCVLQHVQLLLLDPPDVLEEKNTDVGLVES